MRTVTAGSSVRTRLRSARRHTAVAVVSSSQVDLLRAKSGVTSQYKESLVNLDHLQNYLFRKIDCRCWIPCEPGSISQKCGDGKGFCYPPDYEVPTGLRRDGFCDK